MTEQESLVISLQEQQEDHDYLERMYEVLPEIEQHELDEVIEYWLERRGWA